MMPESKRLKRVLELVEPVECIGDIGCDHGYISYALLEENRVKKVIASDISAPSLEKARGLLSSTFPEEYYDIRVGDGFKPMESGELNAAIIMGMGGRLIADILQNDREKVEALDYMILQPMQGAEDLFDYLNRSGFALVQSDLVEEREKFYPILLVKKGENTFIDWKSFAHYGDFIPMAEKELERLRDVRRAVEKSGRADIIEKAESDVKRWEDYLEYSRTCR
ncbi:hypothetical protein PEPNEM18_00075 [Aedoeadaptatus nemausensis]|uniref:Uncharacterized protein n=1 Tax=Aedoeadaptatus nemausensis TaxID=2582829 RepID=A0A6V6XYM4_9FIRM|nr:class I SAM-dependent methyltransferase [Peptoniphilus nemausensis]CAC9922581.1 hypothetical protein PEPNEM18_00075 [Peptoniphilus nemausensis]